MPIQPALRSTTAVRRPAPAQLRVQAQTHAPAARPAVAAAKQPSKAATAAGMAGGAAVGGAVAYGASVLANLVMRVPNTNLVAAAASAVLMPLGAFLGKAVTRGLQKQGQASPTGMAVGAASGAVVGSGLGLMANFVMRVPNTALLAGALAIAVGAAGAFLGNAAGRGLRDE